MNIAIYGGSFDPPHIGHEAICYKVFDVLDIDKLIVVPTYLNPFKKSYHLMPKQRLELLSILFEDDENILVDDFEIKQNKATPSIETVSYLKSIYKPDNIYLIMGADNLEKLHLWKDFEKLKQLVTFVVITRQGYEVKNDIIRFISIDMDISVSSTSLREELRSEFIPKKILNKVKEIWNKE
ncbi:MAG: nicotinate (nicotinamide) nucleotide adenylyltransferase [Campylobacterota bacterium]|nr:nicotinate (nicotinamide) nucleotide adenylyltransferase [Campylobacterota bacterium]